MRPAASARTLPASSIGEVPVNRVRVIKVLKLAGVWVPALLLVSVFAKQGWSKFSDTSGWAVAFRHWGYPDWFRVTIGVIEVTASACLLWGRTAPWGAMMIVVVMLGGMGTHVAYDHGRHITSEVVPLTLALIVLIGRRHQLSRMIRERVLLP